MNRNGECEGKTRLEGYGSIVKTKHLAEERNETPG